MNRNPFQPTVWAVKDLDEEQKATILRAIGQRWTSLILDLESGDEWLQADYSLTVIANLAVPYAHPQLSAGDVLDLMVGLHGALSAKQRYEYEGVLADKDVDYLSALPRQEILCELEVEVQRCVFGLLRALEPCRGCTREREFADWNAQTATSALCEPHWVQSLRSVR